MVKNLFDIPIPGSGELFETLHRNENLHIELIVSSDTPEQTLYDQDHDEAVLLLFGSATLQIEEDVVELKAGDYLCIPAHRRHHVLKTEKGSRWLTIRSKERLC